MGGYAHAAPIERSALKRGAAGGNAPGVGQGGGATGQGLGWAVAPSAQWGCICVP